MGAVIVCVFIDIATIVAHSYTYIEAEVVNLNKDTLDYLIERIKSGEFDPDFQQYAYFDQSFTENKNMDCFSYLLDKLKDEFHIVQTNG